MSVLIYHVSAFLLFDIPVCIFKVLYVIKCIFLLKYYSVQLKTSYQLISDIR